MATQLFTIYKIMVQNINNFGVYIMEYAGLESLLKYSYFAQRGIVTAHNDQVWFEYKAFSKLVFDYASKYFGAVLTYTSEGSMYIKTDCGTKLRLSDHHLINKAPHIVSWTNEVVLDEATELKLLDIKTKHAFRDWLINVFGLCVEITTTKVCSYSKDPCVYIHYCKGETIAQKHILALESGGHIVDTVKLIRTPDLNFQPENPKKSLLFSYYHPLFNKFGEKK